MNEDKITQLRLTRDCLREEFLKFPEKSRDEILFGEWNIKDIIAHLNNWMVHDIDCLTSVIEKKIPRWEPDIDEFNKKGTELRKYYSWQELLSEFNGLSDRLLETYKKFPPELLSVRIWPSIDETPEKFILEELEHWNHELIYIKSKL